ncbi:MAG: hypothetical protein U1A77_25855 [Pirellulales bacterium]
MRVSSETATSRLEELRRRLERRRRSRYQNGGRVPQELWRVAAEVARVHGGETKAARLELNTVQARERGESSRPVVPSTASLPASTTAPQPPHAVSFVELPPLTAASAAECMIDLADESGRPLRNCLKGPASSRFASLSLA